MVPVYVPSLISLSVAVIELVYTTIKLAYQSSNPMCMSFPFLSFFCISPISLLWSFFSFVYYLASLVRSRNGVKRSLLSSVCLAFTRSSSLSSAVTASQQELQRVKGAVRGVRRAACEFLSKVGDSFSDDERNFRVELTQVRYSPLFRLKKKVPTQTTTSTSTSCGDPLYPSCVRTHITDLLSSFLSLPVPTSVPHARGQGWIPGRSRL